MNLVTLIATKILTAIRKVKFFLEDFGNQVFDLWTATTDELVSYVVIKYYFILHIHIHLL